ncbi:hypothetical protein MalM25_25890 [Planctomycetes bacterium MalM25]|nr:hypothetical protein MalM25_25890 [Planctomycetes bacterium MalM25]
MQRSLLGFGCLAAIAFCATLSQAASITIEALDVRGSGVFGHPDVTSVTLNGGAVGGTTVADPLDFEITYTNLNLDGDASANDTITFTLRAAGGGMAQRAWGQGIDTGFGNLNDVTFSVTSVSGVTTDGGSPVQFDGFTGGAIGVGGNGNLNRTAEINGNAVSVMSPTTGGFQFIIDAVDFAPVATVLYDNSGGDFGAISARHHDLQFSAVIPEPTSAMLLAIGAAGFLARRK